MAIVKMKKFTLLTFESAKQKILREMQALSNVEFINLQHEDVIKKYDDLKSLITEDVDLDCSKYEENLSKAKFALEFLEKYVEKESGLKSLRVEKVTLSLDELDEKIDSDDWIKSYQKVKEKEEEITSIDSKVTKLKAEIEILKPWKNLDVYFDDLKKMKNIECLLGSVSKSYEDELEKRLDSVYFEIISKGTNDINLLVLFNKKDDEIVQEILRSIGFSGFKTEHSGIVQDIISGFNEEILSLHEQKNIIKDELKSYKNDLENLEIAYDYFTNVVERIRVSKNFLNTDNICALQGWVAESDSNSIDTICKEKLKGEYYLEFEDVKEEEINDVPIKLKNGKIASAFESVTGMYSYPKYDEIDPTPLLAPFYLIFFGMMVADVGYGLLVLIGSVLALKFLKLKKDQKDFAKFFFYLSFPTILFGLVYGSFFGDIVKLPTQVIDPNRDVNMILGLSLGLGVIQIFLGLFIKAYGLIRIGKIKDAFYDVGSWIITLLSIGGLVATKMLSLPSIIGTVFTVTMIFGMIIIVLTGGREEKSKGAQIGQGLYSLYGISGYIGDLVSYTRLMALGLAGGSIAGALNLLIKTLPGVGALIIGPVLFVLFHIFNLGLSLLGAYVHTARLQYVEYFSKFYEGGGRPFKAFKVSEKYINIRKK